MIYDCFTFFNELELLELRLNVLNDVVDKFVIVEATKTHAGEDKPLNFLANKDRFVDFLDKIIYIRYDGEAQRNPWVYENLQRNEIKKGLINCSDDDIIIISDLDEIVSPQAIKDCIKNIDKGSPVKKFMQYHMCYLLNVLNLKQPLWFHPKVCTYKNFKNALDNVDYQYSEYVLPEVNIGTTATKIRMYHECDIIPYGGWHFSFMGRKERILYKLQNFAHQECLQYADDIVKGVADIIENVNTKNDCKNFRALKYDMLPKYLQNNTDKYKDWLSSTPSQKLCDINSLNLYNKIVYKPLEKVFSVKNSKGHKVLTVCGIKIRFKNEKNCEKLKDIEKFNVIKQCAQKITPKNKLTNFEVHIVEHCNLNCQCCNHFSPLAKPHFADINLMEKDFCRIKELTDGDVDFINLLGGEPLLHPQITDFLKMARFYFPKTALNLVSNGILLAKEDENFWECCKKNNINICVTKYPVKTDWAYIERKAAEYGRTIRYWNNNDILKHSWIFPLNFEGTSDIAENFLTCQDANSCIFLRDGKLFTCVVPPNIHHFNEYFGKNLEVCEKDYIDIYKAKDIDEILRFLATPIPFCRYCNVKGRKYDLPWKTSKRDIHEWS